MTTIKLTKAQAADLAILCDVCIAHCTFNASCVSDAEIADDIEYDRLLCAAAKARAVRTLTVTDGDVMHIDYLAENVLDGYSVFWKLINELQEQYNE